ncbi:armadillo repeat-containing protein 8-like [Hydractinia symbiolongicarpus]|uniref:armadillo repeat-containing protein 8-like n=1 Tax=Hydractinia symbiolongicarpus TaxID=13093 RepID=UPI00254EA28A|nr:armadillo repeat-containing protein 8-like [Hydractinia symbiolongicarpus]
MKMDQTEEPMQIEDGNYMELLGSEDNDERYQAIRNIRNLLIGMKSRKTRFVENGLIEKLLELMIEEDTTVEFAVEAAVVLGTIARGGPDNLMRILDSQALPILCKGICHNDDRLVQACLRSLRICYMSNHLPSDLIFEDANIITNLVELLLKSSQSAEYVANILQRSCKTAADQSMLYDANIIPALAHWLTHKKNLVLVPVLGCLSALVHCNEVIANKLVQCQFSGLNVKEELVRLISRDKPDEIQLEAAICLTKILRAVSIKNGFEQLEQKILTVLVRMCHKEKPLRIRIAGANGLACLIEDDNELQAIAAISNHLIKNVSLYFKQFEHLDKESAEKMKESGLKLFAALSANDEKIRKRIVDSTPDLIPSIHEAVNQQLNISLQISALQCLLSLSRSVHQLRTTFQDVKLWEPVITALKSSISDDIISVASSVLCNLLLHFSPCKEALVDYGALDVLVTLIKRKEVPFRVNGVWGLMNLAYDANDSLKNKIIEVAGIHQILSLLSDAHVDVAVKALGILRNLVTEKEHDIDNLMKNYGENIINSIKPIVLDYNANEKLKEQVLCLLSNISNGTFAKDVIMADKELVKNVIECLADQREQIQVASVFCITNLMRGSDGASIDRQNTLRELGAEKKLQTLLTTANNNLFDRVKVALQQFT